jgi:hypothetical protein
MHNDGLRMPAIFPAALRALALLACTLGGAAEAATCTDQPVSARGEPARLEVMAKLKARGNWRAKVRAMPSLGPPYADFGRAKAASYQCSLEDGRHTCIATGNPCRD